MGGTETAPRPRALPGGGDGAPRVTVLVCVHNGRPHLEASLRSVLAQTFSDFELLVVDDGSTDGSAKVVRALDDPRVRLLINSVNLGLTRSLNRGLAEARGEYVARLDDDDEAHPERLARQVAYLDSHPEVALVGCQLRLINAAGRPILALPQPRATTPLGLRFQMILDNPIAHPAAVFRRSVVWEEMGGYDEGIDTAQDFDLFSRIARGHGVTNLAEKLVSFRVHRGSMTWRCPPEHLAQVRGVYARNYCHALRVDKAPEEWLNLWMNINNPRIAGAVPDAEECFGWLRRIHDAFVAVNPGAEANPEIRRYVAHSAARVACNVARYAPRSALAIFAGALRTGPGDALALAPRFLAMMVLGRWVQRRGTRRPT